MSEQRNAPSYKKTLNLPRTRFPMKANLVENEVRSLERWERMDLYRRLRERRHGAPRYVFHDGPPYANGSIHLGHLVNKVLKDIVVRSRGMLGFDCPFLPGWDCHGLPIEHKVMQVLGDEARESPPMQIRSRCRAYAEKYIEIQSRQLQRLLTLGDYGDPYLTMDPRYEAAVLEVFAELVGKGLVYRAFRPVHWSIANQTALAEAELEYADREDTSVYVLFEVADPAKLPASLAAPSGARVDLMIWTTTPWTLPANLAVAVAAGAGYGLYRLRHGDAERLVVLADSLAERVAARGPGGAPERLGRCAGRELAGAGTSYRHPFLDDGRPRPVLCADHVTLEDGTGLVHTAPGHGIEDYQTGLAHGLEIYSPVRADGRFDDSAPGWLRDASVWEANDLVCERLRADGALYASERFAHSYPHDWRSKTPVIFRATEQWFIGVDRALSGEPGGASLRRLALDETASRVRFIPEWGRRRMRGMLESRPDWCLSRQRAWGLPIPAFFRPDGGEALLTRASVRAVAAALRRHGSDHWFRAGPGELLAGYDPGADPDAPEWLRGDAAAVSELVPASDIFDVWFESGSSWNAVVRERFGPESYPTDLYLEGSDQHRGWFQLSLLPALGTTGRSPFKAVLTHGFIVDRDGRKMSKSLGNTLEVEELLGSFGADVCRWWVSSLNTDYDIKVDLDFFEGAGEEYRKVRNTIRFLLSNLEDFDPAAHRVELGPADAASLDAWVLSELRDVVERVRRAYDELVLRKVQEALYRFCNETLSAVYLAAVKDRLYCDRPDSPRRRRTQTALHELASALVRLLAPLIPHTADEAWACLAKGGPDAVESVHLSLFPEPRAVPVHPGWPAVMRARPGWLKAAEDARSAQGIDNPLDCGLRVPPWEGGDASAFAPVDLADLCGVSRFEVADGLAEPALADLRGEPRCDRSWKRDETVRPRSDGGLLSDRDADAVGV